MLLVNLFSALNLMLTENFQISVFLLDNYEVNDSCLWGFFSLNFYFLIVHDK